MRWKWILRRNEICSQIRDEISPGSKKNPQLSVSSRWQSISIEPAIEELTVYSIEDGNVYKEKGTLSGTSPSLVELLFLKCRLGASFFFVTILLQRWFYSEGFDEFISTTTTNHNKAGFFDIILIKGESNDS